jgi:hypothetical protein
MLADPTTLTHILIILRMVPSHTIGIPHTLPRGDDGPVADLTNSLDVNIS